MSISNKLSQFKSKGIENGSIELIKEEVQKKAKFREEQLEESMEMMQLVDEDRKVEVQVKGKKLSLYKRLRKNYSPSILLFFLIMGFNGGVGLCRGLCTINMYKEYFKIEPSQV